MKFPLTKNLQKQKPMSKKFDTHEKDHWSL